LSNRAGAWGPYVSSAPGLPPDDSPFDAVTLRFYATEAPTYAASGPDGSSRFLKPFLRMLPPQAYILELGCGGGRDAAAMLTAGSRVDATEGAPEVAREAEKRLGCPVRVMRFDELMLWQPIMPFGRMPVFFTFHSLISPPFFTKYSLP
jgi:hypothetical protein